jgi:hypothetical protein
MAGERKKLFYLREHDEAFRDAFSRVIRLRGEEAYPLLKEIPTEPRPAIHTSQVTLPSGEALTNEPFEMKVAFRFNLSDMVSGNIDAFTVSAEASGRLVLLRAQSQELGSTREAVVETAVQRLDLSQKQAGEAYTLAETFESNPRSVWGYVQGLTRLSQRTPWQDGRFNLDRAASRLLTTVH